MKNNLANSPFYIEVLPKGIRSNYFYITDITKCPMSHIVADDNGARVKTRSTNKLYCAVGENAHTVHMNDNQYFYNTHNSNTYTRSYVSINDVIMLKRSYCVSISLPLSRTIVSFASQADGHNIWITSTLNRLRDDECACLSSYGLHIQWSLYFSFVYFKYPNRPVAERG